MMMRKPTVMALIALALSFRALSAQSGRDALRATVSDTVRASYLARTVSEAVTANGEPRSIQVIRVPIPDAVKGRPGLRFDLEPEPQFHVVSVRGGVLSGRAAESDLLVTLAVPADARAGRRVAARAVFRTPQTEVEVPIEMRVTPVYRVGLVTPAQIDGLRPGERFEVQTTIRNDGNAADTVRLSHELPDGWGNGSRDTLLLLLPHEAAIRTIRIVVPKNSGTGSFFVRTVAASRAGPVASLTTLGVGNQSANESPPGVVVRTSVGTVAVEKESAATVAQLAVSGPLTNEIRIDGRLASRPSVGSAALRGLSRVGSYVTTPHFTAWGSTWRGSLGSTVADFGDVTGVNAGGSGVSFNFDNHTTAVEVTAARPAAGSAHDGSIFGLELARQMQFGRLTAAASRLRTTGAFEQQLSAVGLQLVTPRIHDTQLTSGVAYRDYLSSSGMGVVAGAARHTEKTDAEFKYVHAAGGTAAFARAENELSGSIVQSLSKRLDMTASLYLSKDANTAAHNVRSKTIGFAQQFLLNERVSLHADERSTSFDAEGDPFSFGNTQTHVGAGAAARHMGITFTSDLGVERLTRTVNTTSINSSESGYAYNWHGAASRSLSFGSFSLDAAYAHNDPGTGYMPEQMAVSLRADRAQLSVGPRNLFLDAEVGYSRWSGIRSMATIRVGTTYVLPFDMEVAASVERNPLFYSMSTHVPWVFALRVDKSVSMPRIMTGSAGGVVFQDYNGNGRQDADEPGMAGIVVRRGSARATSSNDGRYRFWEQSAGRTVVDPASLPFGWIVNNESTGENIALVPTTRVEVVLQPGAAESARNLDLSAVAVLARDAEGRSWSARRVSPTQAVFEALPVGAYEILLDFAALAEPLRIDGPAPRITVTRESSTRIVVPISGRPLRFKSH